MHVKASEMYKITKDQEPASIAKVTFFDQYGAHFDYFIALDMLKRSFTVE
jgi:hypothetical protein